MFTFIEQYILNYFPCNTAKILQLLRVPCCLLIGLVGKLGFCGELYSTVHGEKKSPGIQSWPPLVGGAGEVLQRGLPKPYELAGPLCECPVEKIYVAQCKSCSFFQIGFKISMGHGILVYTLFQVFVLNFFVNLMISIYEVPADVRTYFYIPVCGDRQTDKHTPCH